MIRTLAVAGATLAVVGAPTGAVLAKRVTALESKEKALQAEVSLLARAYPVLTLPDGKLAPGGSLYQDDRAVVCLKAGWDALRFTGYATGQFTFSDGTTSEAAGFLVPGNNLPQSGWLVAVSGADQSSLPHSC